jgi:hypothetical protein
MRCRVDATVFRAPSLRGRGSTNPTGRAAIQKRTTIRMARRRPHALGKAPAVCVMRRSPSRKIAATVAAMER